MNGLYIKRATNAWHDPKFIQAGPLAAELYWRMVSVAKDDLTDGFIAEERLPELTFDIPDGQEQARRLTVPLKSGGRPLLAIVDGGWKITAFLDHNPSASEVHATQQKQREDKRQGGLARALQQQQNRSRPAADRQQQSSRPSADGQQERNSSSPDIQQPSSTPVSVFVPAVTAVLQPPAHVGVPGNGSADPPVPDDGPAWEADDPQYALVPEYSGDEHLAQWQAKIGKVQSRDHLASLHTLHRLHVHCRRSLRELTAYIEHVATDPDARKWWGAGKSPAGWLNSRDGGEPTWRKVRAHWVAAGGKLSRAVVKAPDPGPDPGWDRSCDCRRGWRDDPVRGVLGFCEKCARGAWLKAGGRDK